MRKSFEEIVTLLSVIDYVFDVKEAYLIPPLVAFHRKQFLMHQISIK